MKNSVGWGLGIGAAIITVIAGAILAPGWLSFSPEKIRKRYAAKLPSKKIVNKVSTITERNPAFQFEVEGYTGKWFQIYRSKNNFQNDEAIETTAEYTLDPKTNIIKVVNTERIGTGGSKAKTATGKAIKETADGDGTKLLVTFFGPFAGSYQIIDLGPINAKGQYSWALVGSPFNNMFWILSRDPTMSQVMFNVIRAFAEKEYGLVYDRPVGPLVI